MTGARCRCLVVRKGVAGPCGAPVAATSASGWFCSRHDDEATPTPTPAPPREAGRQCTATTRAGAPCASSARHEYRGRAVCALHLRSLERDQTEPVRKRGEGDG